MVKVNLIYYDENISFNSENYGYVKNFKNKIEGAFFAIKNEDALKKIIKKIKLINFNGKFTLITSGRAAEKIIPICSDIINNIIIFCFYIDKYIPLKNKYSKIKNVLNSFPDIFDNLKDSNFGDDSNLIGCKIITFEDYQNKYIKFHKKISEFFNSNYSPVKFDNSYKNIFNNFIDSTDLDNKYYAKEFVNRVKKGTVSEFIEAYTGENILCYSLNKWLRDCIENQYEKVKYFAGPFSYSLYKFAKEEKNNGVYHTKKFYRKMTIKISDYYLYKILEGELICYPAFTSTSEKDISKYNFPTYNAIEVNKLSPNDVSVVLIINYQCNNSSYPTPCINVSDYSVNAGEQEFIFPPFSFFKIEKIEENEGTPNNPHIIHMTTPNKKVLIEFEIKNNKTIYYNRENNELYSK